MLQFAYTLLVPWCVVHVEQKTCNDAFNNNKEKENYNSQGVNEQSKHASLPACTTPLFFHKKSTKSVLSKKSRMKGIITIHKEKGNNNKTIYSIASSS